jgi:hypothetical protein
VTRWQISLAIVGEAILLGCVGAFFLYVFIQSFGWPLGSALMPRIVVVLGVPFLIARIISLTRRTIEQQERIMDTGFRIGDDPKREAQNFLRISAFIVGLYFAIWVFGFHIALPAGMFGYLFFFGKVGWVGSTIVALCFLAFIVGVYDNVLHISWHEPLIFKLLP